MQRSIALYITGIDDAGRPLGVLLGQDPAAAVTPVAIMPGGTRFSKDDLHWPRFPLKIPLSAPGIETPFHLLDLEGLAAAARFIDGVHRPLPATRTGDVVHAEDCRGWDDGDGSVAVHLVGQVTVVGPARNLGDAARVAQEFSATQKVPDDGKIHFQASLIEIDDITHEAAAEAARHEPDTALVAAWLGTGGTIESLILVHTGAYLFHQGNVSCEDAGMGAPHAPGFFALRQAHPWGYTAHEGEPDSGIDGTLVAVSAEQAAAEFGFAGADDVAAELDAQYPYDYDGDIFAAIARPAGPERDWNKPAIVQL